MAISLSASSFLALLFETFFFAIFLVVYGLSIYLGQKQTNSRSTTGEKLIEGFSFLLCVFIVIHWILSVWITFDIYMNIPRGVATELAFWDDHTPRALARLILTEIQLWLGDFVLIYRMFIICQKSYLKCIPALTLNLGTLICSCAFLVVLGQSPPVLPSRASAHVRGFSIAAFVCSLVGNMYCTAMIAFTAWLSQRDLRFKSSSRLEYIFKIFIESSGFWIVCLFLTFLCYTSGSAAYVIPYDSLVPILGVSFCIITVRIRMHADLEVNIKSGHPSVAYSDKTMTTLPSYSKAIAQKPKPKRSGLPNYIEPFPYPNGDVKDPNYFV